MIYLYYSDIYLNANHQCASLNSIELLISILSKIHSISTVKLSSLKLRFSQIMILGDVHLRCAVYKISPFKNAQIIENEH